MAPARVLLVAALVWLVAAPGGALAGNTGKHFGEDGRLKSPVMTENGSFLLGNYMFAKSVLMANNDSRATPAEKLGKIAELMSLMTPPAQVDRTPGTPSAYYVRVRDWPVMFQKPADNDGLSLLWSNVVQAASQYLDSVKTHKAELKRAFPWFSTDLLREGHVAATTTAVLSSIPMAAVSVTVGSSESGDDSNQNRRPYYGGYYGHHHHHHHHHHGGAGGRGGGGDAEGVAAMVTTVGVGASAVGTTVVVAAELGTNAVRSLLAYSGEGVGLLWGEPLSREEFAAEVALLDRVATRD